MPGPHHQRFLYWVFGSGEGWGWVGGGVGGAKGGCDLQACLDHITKGFVQVLGGFTVQGLGFRLHSHAWTTPQREL